MDISNLIWCFSTDFSYCSYHRPHCDLVLMESVMDTAVPAPEPEDLRNDLVICVIQLQADLTNLGLNMAYITDFLKETRALEVGAQIPKLRKHIELMTKLKDKNAPSNSTSALVSTLAPSSASVGAAQKVVKKRGRDPNSSTIVVPPSPPKAKKTRIKSSDFPIRQHGRYQCLSNVQAQTYENAVLMAEFVFGRLILEHNLRDWKRIREQWYRDLPFPVGIPHSTVIQYISNGYLSSRNLLEAAQNNNLDWIRIGTNRPSRANNGSGARPPPPSGDSGKTSQDSQPLAGNADIDPSKGAAHGARRGRTPKEDDATWAPCGGARAAPPPTACILH